MWFGLNGLGKKLYFGLNGLGKTYDRIWPRLMKKNEYPPGLEAEIETGYPRQRDTLQKSLIHTNRK